MMVLVASETGHVYTFATQKLQPMITSEAGKALIQTCLNSPDQAAAAGLGGAGAENCRMTETGYCTGTGDNISVDIQIYFFRYEEHDLSYNVPNMEGAEDEEDENRDFNQAESKLLQVHTHKNMENALIDFLWK